MTRISTYPNVIPATGDKVLGTDASDTSNDPGGETVNFKITDIVGGANTDGLYSPNIIRPDLAPVAFEISHVPGLIPDGDSANGAANLSAIQDVIDWLTAKTYGGALVGSLVSEDYASPLICLGGAIELKDKVSLVFDTSVQFRLTTSSSYMLQTTSDGSQVARRVISGGYWDANQNATAAGFYIRNAKSFTVGGNGMFIDRADVVGMLIGQSGFTASGEIVVKDMIIRNGSGGYSHTAGSTGIKTTGVSLNDSEFRALTINGYNLGIQGEFYHCDFHDTHCWSYGGVGGPGSMDVGFDLTGSSRHNTFSLCQAGSPHVAGFRDAGSLNAYLGCRSHMIDDVPATGTVPAFDFTSASNNSVHGCSLDEVDADFSAAVAGTTTDHEIIGNVATTTVWPVNVSRLSVSGPLTTADVGELTIASGAITVTGSYHRVDTEADAASDDLDTINGGADGQRLIIRPAVNARTVVVKDATDNLRLEGDFTMDNQYDNIELLYDATGSVWIEVSRSNTGA